MKKTGIVMKADNKKAYIMTSNGEFFHVKLHGGAAEIGSEYTGELVKRNLYRFTLRHTAAAAALAFALLAGGGVYAYNVPVSTITVSSNPEVQLKTNIFNRVIDISSQDKDIEENLDLKNSTVDKAVLDVVNALSSKKAQEKKADPVSIEINGKEIDTSNIKKNLDNKSVNYTIKKQNTSNTNSSDKTEQNNSNSNNNKKENNSTKKDKLPNNKKN